MSTQANSQINNQIKNHKDNQTSIYNPKFLNKGNVTAKETGLKRGWIQIKKTISFEFLRNGTKMISMLITGALIFILSWVIQFITEERSGESVPTALEYVQNYLNFIDLFVLIVAVTFFGSIIAEDFEKETGNLLFPKIPKERLLLGRYIARFTYSMLCIGFFYLLIGIISFLKYDSIPHELWGSMLWAELYLFGVTAFITMFSALMQRTSSAMIFGILIILIGFQLLNMIFLLSGITWEPVYFLTYYAKIITAWFDMPELDQRFKEMQLRPNNTAIYYQWSTPSPLGALVGIAIYSFICLSVAYYFYRRRQ